MHEFLAKVLGTTITLLLILAPSLDTTHGVRLPQRFFDNYTTHTRPNRQPPASLVVGQYLSERFGTSAGDGTTALAARRSSDAAAGDDGRAVQARTYYGVPAPGGFVPAFDPISVLASLAFLAFLLQSFAALFDRTRSIIPTIVSSRRRSNTWDYDDIESRVLRAIEEYANVSNDLLDGEGKDERSAGSSDDLDS